jgi:hypothetical protein
MQLLCNLSSGAKHGFELKFREAVVAFGFMKLISTIRFWILIDIRKCLGKLLRADAHRLITLIIFQQENVWLELERSCF